MFHTVASWQAGQTTVGVPRCQQAGISTDTHTDTHTDILHIWYNICARQSLCHLQQQILK